MKKLFRYIIFYSPASTKWFLGWFIRLHNYCYHKITELASVLEGGLNPKHRITNYHQYFLDRIDKTNRVLDLGCGIGYLAYDLADKAREVIGIDISNFNIEYARAHYQRSNLKFLIGDATKHNFDKRFDCVVLSNVLEHIKGREALLKKIKNLSPKLLLRVPMVTRDWTAVYKRDNGYEYKLDETHEIEFTLEDIFYETARANWKIKSYQVNWGEFWGELVKHE
ncbi:MAG: class I SAM-dependent methyltransferase [Patescibacteria group bacterium]